MAINPAHAIAFLTSYHWWTVLGVLGSVMLVITGGEAMYADMGHFERLPIRLGWITVAYPALLLNYFGQGAFLLSGQSILGENIFFSMVPRILLSPMVILATLATVIASQALISGAYSLTTQAISLGLFPLFPIVHTNREQEGQIYVPMVNWGLCIGSIALVSWFGSSARLASAYGLAVSGVMLITTLSIAAVAYELWHWRIWIIPLCFLPMAMLDGVFLAANSLKFVEGGFIPVGIGFLVLLLSSTWKWGQRHVSETYAHYPVMKMKDLVELKQRTKALLSRPSVVMTMEPIKTLNDDIPLLKQMFYDRYNALPRDLIFLTIKEVKVPKVKRRYDIVKFQDDKKFGSVSAAEVYYGFMEEPNVERILKGLAKHKEIPIFSDPKTWLIHVMRERIIKGKSLSPIDTMRFLLYQLIKRNTDTSDHFFGLGKDIPLTAEILPVTINSS